MGISAKETVSRNDDAKKDAAASFFLRRNEKTGEYPQKNAYSQHKTRGLKNTGGSIFKPFSARFAPRFGSVYVCLQAVCALRTSSGTCLLLISGRFPGGLSRCRDQLIADKKAATRRWRLVSDQVPRNAIATPLKSHQNTSQ
ncbi:hypothetical protein KDM87_17285 [Undibacterium sp. FT147W]|uniref:Uncharacterized protein n=1 Tax=Undibacterium rivi TaxID=2828729 RepID=A0ABS5H710_9BURK|nr:hypothetical protein [Undibacterium rivi]MBR7794352.1 hypothetical protein [Undibacterium rivi]